MIVAWSTTRGGWLGLIEVGGMAERTMSGKIWTKGIWCSNCHYQPLESSALVDQTENHGDLCPGCPALNYYAGCSPMQALRNLQDEIPVLSLFHGFPKHELWSMSVLINELTIISSKPRVFPFF